MNILGLISQLIGIKTLRLTASILQPNTRNHEPNQNSTTQSSTALEVEIINPMESNIGGNWRGNNSKVK